MPDIQEGQTATNPKTGQKIVFRGGQWHSAGTAAPAAKPLSAKDAQALAARNANMTALANKYASVRERYNRDLKGRGISSLLEYLPIGRNKGFDSEAAGLADLANAVFKVPGMGAQSDADLAQFIRANQPSHSDSDDQIEAKLGNIENRLRANKVPIAATDFGGWKVIR